MIARKLTLATACWVCVLISLANAVERHDTPVRTWTEAGSAREVAARLIDVDGEILVLERARDAKQFRVPTARFSEEDRDYVRQVLGDAAGRLAGLKDSADRTDRSEPSAGLVAVPIVFQEPAKPAPAPPAAPAKAAAAGAPKPNELNMSLPLPPAPAKPNAAPPAAPAPPAPVPAAPAPEVFAPVYGSVDTFKSEAELLVSCRDADVEEVQKACETAGFEVVAVSKLAGLVRCRWKGDEVLSRGLDQIKRTKTIGYIQPNYAIPLNMPRAKALSEAPAVVSAAAVSGRMRIVPNDPHYPALWGLDSIRAPEAWCSSVGCREVVVAVIDTGVDYQHEDLRDNMWRNPNETPGDGIDNDDNGYVDDIHGVDVVARNGDPRPFVSAATGEVVGHGTHVAGTIGAVGNNAVGVTGVDWQVSIMAIQTFSNATPTPQNPDGAVITSFDQRVAIYYAVNNGARVINASWGGAAVDPQDATRVRFDIAVMNAISYAEERGVLFVAAAGNEGRDTDALPATPSSLPHPNILSVAAVDRQDQLAQYSNFGRHTVDLGAPGGAGGSAEPAENILSTLPGNQYGYLAGTSMAAPHVAGAAALLLGHPAYCHLSAEQVKQLLLKQARPAETLQGKSVTGGVLDLSFLGCPACQTVPCKSRCFRRHR